MVLVNNRFWRLEPSPGHDVADILNSSVLSSPRELIKRIRRLDGIVIGTWETEAKLGRVHALGIVQNTDGRSAIIDWRHVDLTLHPSGAGSAQWRTRPFFQFADLVASRYGLSAHFASAFAQHAGDYARNSAQNAGVDVQPQTERPHKPAATLAMSESVYQAPALQVGPSRLGQCNRVAPTGEIFANPARGMFMGNRTSPPRWLICDLHFKRDLAQPRKYTKLFFLDEAVALAAGHRPCNTCRRERYKAYITAVTAAMTIRGAADLDTLLHTARSKPYEGSPISSLPDGAFVALPGNDYRLKWSGLLHRWTPGGYVDAATPMDLRVNEATILTPGPSLAALLNGYQAVVHGSARRG